MKFKTTLKGTLLYFNEERYNNIIQLIESHAKVFISANKELQRLTELKSIQAENGNFVYKLLEHHRKKLAANEYLKDVKFEKYIDLIELNYSILQELENQYKVYKDYAFKFYQKNHLFYEVCENSPQPEHKEALKKAGNKIEIPIKDTFEISSKNEISVTLSKEYFKLYSTHRNQLVKINQIEAFVESSKSIGLTYKDMNKHITKWADLQYNLESWKPDYNKILTIN